MEISGCIEEHIRCLFWDEINLYIFNFTIESEAKMSYLLSTALPVYSFLHNMIGKLTMHDVSIHNFISN